MNQEALLVKIIGSHNGVIEYQCPHCKVTVQYPLLGVANNTKCPHCGKLIEFEKELTKE
jgi:phage FluMu protein Com